MENYTIFRIYNMRKTNTIPKKINITNVKYNYRYVSSCVVYGLFTNKMTL